MKKSFLKHIASPLIIIAVAIQPAGALAAKSIIAFGDSITQGLWEIEEHIPGERVGGYEPDLEKLTDAINNHHDVLNFGYSGERTMNTERHPYPQGGINRLELSVLPAAPSARYILILEGTNDYWDGIPAQSTVANLRYMIKRARDYGIEPILGTLTPDTRSFAQDKNIPYLNALIREMAADENVAVADFYPRMIDHWDTVYAGCAVLKGEPDTVHPCREGYEKMAEIWFEALNLPVILPTVWLNLLLK